MDLLVSIPALVAVVSVLIAVKGLMLLDGDHGPLLYRARRVGRGGREFDVLKIRTMAVTTAGPAITTAGDPRVTSTGRFLRRFRIDEVPQLVNVVRGEMSLVGPRPEDPRFVDWSNPVHRKVFTALPGLTGLTQLQFVDEAAMLGGPDPETTYRTVVLPRKVAIDVEYLDSWSLRSDVHILVATAVTVLGGPRR